MARSKYPEVTRKRILDAAYRLFLEKGYEHTTIQDIVDALGDLSKGAVYHHFKSKEDIMDAVSEMLYLGNPWEVVRNPQGRTGLEKIRWILLYSTVGAQGLREISQMIPNFLQSPKLLAMQLEQTIYRAAPPIQLLVEEGIADGSIRSQYPKQLTEVFLLVTNLWMSVAVFPVAREELVQKIHFLKELTDSVGLPLCDGEVMAALEKMSGIFLGEEG